MSGFELAFATSTVASVGELGVPDLYNNIRGKFASSKNLDDQYDLLDKDMQILLAIKEDKEREVRTNHHKDTTSTYKHWIDMVSKAEGEFQKLTDEYHDKKRLPWWRFQQRSRLSEDIAKKHTHVCQLVLQINGQHSSDFLVDKPPPCVLKDLHVPQISGYPTLQNALEKILDSLKNNMRIRVIGVWGTKGVGKTTIVQNLNNHEEVAKLFDIVIFVKVADETRKIQEEIAKRLMLDIETIKDQSDEVARKIHVELKMRLRRP